MKAGAKAFAGVFLFTLLMITREGMETALLMGTLLFQEAGMNIIVGAAAGTLSAAFFAWLWSRYGHRVNLALFFQVTAVFLSVFVVQLAIYGLHELTEANLFHGSEALHWATEPYGPDGRYGQFLSYMLLVLPVGWLAFAVLFGPRKPAGAIIRIGADRRALDPASGSRYCSRHIAGVRVSPVGPLRCDASALSRRLKIML